MQATQWIWQALMPAMHYRQGLCTAGRNLAWWASFCGQQKDDYAACG